jgi:predicted Zn-dependent protease
MGTQSNKRIGMLQQMLDKEPHDPFLNYAIALEYAAIGEDKEAIRIIEALLNLDPGYLAGYYQLGKLYELQNETEKAIEVYKKGREVALQTQNLKTLGELNEALLMLDAEDDFL